MINEDEKSRCQEDKQFRVIARSVSDVAIQKEIAPIPTFPHKGRSIVPSLVREGKGGYQSKKIAFTKPSRATNEVRGELASTETLSFRCKRERWRLMRGAVAKSSKKIAFTLAEVLITLGIIGVVAAMTLPALITKHQKKVVATRVKQFASVWQQAYRQVGYEQGTEYYWGSLIAKDPESTFNFYNETFGKYLRTIKVEKSQYGITGALQNGSGFYFYRYCAQAETCSCTYLIFCPYYKDCKQLADNGQINYGEYIPDGKKTFGFYLAGKAPISGWDGTREWLMQKCSSNQKGYCTTLIQYDGWEIKDDYLAW